MTPNRHPIRALVVDDSAFMRKAISRMLQSEGDIQVVGTAASGREVLPLVERLQPDVITLDVVMPDMDGIEVLRTIMSARPTPVLMLSRLTKDGAAETLEALALGAVDVIDKPADLTNMNMHLIAESLVAKVRAAAGVDTGRLGESARAGDTTPERTGSLERNASPDARESAYDLLVVGSSTGGPPALQRLLSDLPPLPCGIVLVQHMPPGFTGALAARLDAHCVMPVKHAETGDIVERGRVLVAPSGWQIHFEQRPRAVTVRMDKRPRDIPHAPSVDVAMGSAAEVFGGRTMGVLLTGMGADGAKGMLAIRQAGGMTIAESESSAMIFGMPRAAIELGAAVEVHDLADIAARAGELACGVANS